MATLWVHMITSVLEYFNSLLRIHDEHLRAPEPEPEISSSTK